MHARPLFHDGYDYFAWGNLFHTFGTKKASHLCEPTRVCLLYPSFDAVHVFAVYQNVLLYSCCSSDFRHRHYTHHYLSLGLYRAFRSNVSEYVEYNFLNQQSIFHRLCIGRVSLQCVSSYAFSSYLLLRFCRIPCTDIAFARRLSCYG